jgi:hypothetical protein
VRVKCEIKHKRQTLEEIPTRYGIGRDISYNILDFMPDGGAF